MSRISILSILSILSIEHWLARCLHDGSESRFSAQKTYWLDPGSSFRGSTYMGRGFLVKLNKPFKHLLKDISKIEAACSFILDQTWFCFWVWVWRRGQGGVLSSLPRSRFRSRPPRKVSQDRMITKACLANYSWQPFLNLDFFIILFQLHGSQMINIVGGVWGSQQALSARWFLRASTRLLGAPTI